ncbi:TetR/AcrR family transcriptional regulator [Clostridioides difficile]
MTIVSDFGHYITVILIICQLKVSESCMESKKLTRKEQASLTKQKLFENAIYLFKEKGYDSTTVSEICFKSGVSKGTFYVHYESKEDIIRESYYFNLGAYIENEFNDYINQTPNISVVDKIIKFLILEFDFTSKTGHELTCLAYITNLSSCITSKSQHFQRRVFSKELKNLLDEAYKKNLIKNDLSVEEVFLYLETSVRGMMATWCFSNANFDIKTVGKKYILNILKGLIKI